MKTWIEYLYSAYPATAKKLTPTTEALLEHQFADVDDQAMGRVVRLAVKRSKWFPTVKELREIHDEIADTADTQEAVEWAVTTRLEKLRLELSTWRDCPGDCGERVPPGVALCPFCADLADMISMLAAAEAY